MPVSKSGRYGVHKETTNEKGERIWIEKDTGSRKKGDTHERENPSMGGELNRVFIWEDPDRGVKGGITAYPDRLIPGLRCPDCACPACETDQIGIALCTGTPGWYFYYRQLTDGYGKPKTRLQQVGDDYVEVPEYDVAKIERQPDGNFKEKKEDDEK